MHREFGNEYILPPYRLLINKLMEIRNHPGANAWQIPKNQYHRISSALDFYRPSAAVVLFDTVGIVELPMSTNYATTLHLLRQTVNCASFDVERLDPISRTNFDFSSQFSPIRFKNSDEFMPPTLIAFALLRLELQRGEVCELVGPFGANPIKTLSTL